MFIIYPSVLGSAASISDCDSASEAFAQWLWWRGKHGASATWSRRWKREGWIRALSTRISIGSHGETTHAAWISSLEAFPASRSRTLEVARASTTSDTSGPFSEKDCGLFDLESSSWRTSTESLRLGAPATTPFSTMSSETWKAWVSERRRAALQRAKSAHPIDGNGGSFLEWPTATVGDSRNSARHSTTTGVSHSGTTLIDAVRMWPTPTAAEGGKIPCSANYGNTGLSNHPEIVGKPTREKGKKSRKKDERWPTPTSRDWKDSPGMSFDRKDRGPEGRIDLLPRAVFADGRLDRASHSSDGKPLGLLNPSWVEQLMGFPLGWSSRTLVASTDSEASGTP